MPRAMELVGRQREQAALGNAIAVAAEADGGILLIAGDAGVGKTALVESALAEDGWAGVARCRRPAGGETLRTRRGRVARLPACGP